MAQRPFDPYSPHDAVDDVQTPPKKRAAKKATAGSRRAPKPTDVQPAKDEQMVVKPTAAKKTPPGKTAGKKTAAKKAAAGKKASGRRRG